MGAPSEGGVADGEPPALPLVLTAAQMRRSDRWAIDTLGLPGLLLMENAGREVARVAVELWREGRAGAPELPGTGRAAARPHVAVLCGAGQNAGDGFVAARHLASAGVPVRVHLTLPFDRLSGDAATSFRALAGLGVVPIDDGAGEADVSAWQARLAGARVIVDAVFGTGLNKDVHGPPAAALAAANQCVAARLAVDLPSGLAADTGQVLGMAFAADVTVTMGARKLALALEPSTPVDRVRVADLGAPVYAPPGGGPYAYLLEEAALRARLPRLAPDAHKGSRGHLLLVAGSVGRTGASLLAAQAALRAGAGLVTVATTGPAQAALDAKVAEVMTARYAEGDDAEPASCDEVSRLAVGKRAVALGPGMPVGPGARALVRRVAAELPLPLVIDADGLNHLGVDFAELLRQAPAPRVLTPHPGEAARLLATTPAAIGADRPGSARELAARSGAIVVLKGARTLVAAPDGSLYVNPAVEPALATAGSGDVLTGVIAALLARGCAALDAALCGVFAHGRAGAMARAALGTSHLVAGDLPLAVARWFELPAG